MRARGIDPGDTIGWCDIERESAGVFRYVDGGTWEASTIQRAYGLPCSLSGLSVLCVETPAEMHPNEIAAQFQVAIRDRRSMHSAAACVVQTVRNLLDTRAMAERIAGAAAPYVRVMEPTAAACRSVLGVKFGAQQGRGEKMTVDQQVKAKLQLYVRGWPARSNVHVRDAGAAAFYALACPEDLAALGIAT